LSMANVLVDGRRGFWSDALLAGSPRELISSSTANNVSTFASKQRNRMI
jgi:hypothetical protein